MAPSSSRLAHEIELHDQKPVLADAQAEIERGLSTDPKSLSPKFFYDQRGSALFEAITDLPEYYLTRAELSILRSHGDEIAEAIGDSVCLIEYGSGSSTKIRVLLESCHPSAYVPVDISREYLLHSARRIADAYPWLYVCPTCADYTVPFGLPTSTDGLTRVAFFPGSSLGNFEPADAKKFMQGVRKVVGKEGWLLIGVDTKKDESVLNRAYNDPGGVTAEFNRNILRHLNERFGANFDAEAFRHFARYNRLKGRIEMYLVSDSQQDVRIGGEIFRFTPGEQLHTENSYKYDLDQFVVLAEATGFRQHETWFDADHQFMELLLKAA
ncbi:MAG: L-histidine N(alpha)-methyltransferase [Pseudomonadales bacterium]|nr:L-histidine N(alpha)-methyltransferase [Pseudomonadales bacterium]